MREAMTNRLMVSLAILIGSVVIAIAIIVSPVMTPYRFSGEGSLIWRFNAVTGEGVVCKPGGSRRQGYYLDCDLARSAAVARLPEGEARRPAEPQAVPANISPAICELARSKGIIDDERFRGCKPLESIKPH